MTQITSQALQKSGNEQLKRGVFRRLQKIRWGDGAQTWRDVVVCSRH